MGGGVGLPPADQHASCLLVQNLVGKLHALRQHIFDGRVERASKKQEEKAAQIIQAHWKVGGCMAVRQLIRKGFHKGIVNATLLWMSAYPPPPSSS
jgi:hypothetical protein